MSGWLLQRFDELRRELLAAGKLKPWCDELRATFSPDGALSLYEVIDSTTPRQWREAVERMNNPPGAQLALASRGEVTDGWSKANNGMGQAG